MVLLSKTCLTSKLHSTETTEGLYSVLIGDLHISDVYIHITSLYEYIHKTKGTLDTNFLSERLLVSVMTGKVSKPRAMLEEFSKERSRIWNRFGKDI